MTHKREIKIKKKKKKQSVRALNLKFHYLR